MIEAKRRQKQNLDDHTNHDDCPADDNINVQEGSEDDQRSEVGLEECHSNSHNDPEDSIRNYHEC